MVVSKASDKTYDAVIDCEKLYHLVREVYQSTPMGGYWYSTVWHTRNIQYSKYGAL